MPDPGRYDRKQEHVLRTAAAVFADRGFDNASIRAIAKRAKVSIAGLYYYVRSKEELLCFIQLNAFDSLVARYERDVENVVEPEDRLRLLVGNHLERFLTNMAELVVCSREIDRLEGDLRKRVRERQRAYFKLAVDVFTQLAEKHGGSSVSPRTSALAMFGAINWLHTWYQPKSGPSAERLTDDFTHLFIQGALPRRTNSDERPLPAAKRSGSTSVGS